VRTFFWAIGLLLAMAAPASAETTRSTTCDGGLVCRTTIVEWLDEPPTKAAAADEGACPSPATCDRFRLYGLRWAAAADGSIRIPYLLAGRHPQVPEAIAREAFRRMGEVWTAANPRVRFAEQGTTLEPAGDPPFLPDGRNEFGFGPSPLLTPGAGAVATLTSVGGTIVEADVVLSVSVLWSWRPCEQSDGACAGDGTPDVDAAGLVEAKFTDLAGVVAHELGHVLGLDHASPGLGEGATRQLTMHPVAPSPPERRIFQTLGLGDVLGVRALYPCGECDGPPRVFVP
jgi:hypothetical protein